jgi:hypothetical protein
LLRADVDLLDCSSVAILDAAQHHLLDAERPSGLAITRRSERLDGTQHHILDAERPFLL